MNVPWAELLLASLRDAGCGDLVVSPGSRSTPLVLAAARLGLSCHVLYDERAAGFFALGRSRATGRPTVLVCTSGTAGAHYLPAVIEACHARLPLVVLTADRPPELHDCAAPQTIDQQHMFGRAVRGFADVGVADPHPAALRGLRRRAAQMVALSLCPEPGPVHVNVPARSPLEPAADPTPEERHMIEAARAIAELPIGRAVAGRPTAPGSIVDEVAAACRTARSGLLVAGPLPLAGAPETSRAVVELARATGFPLLAEAASQLRWTGDEPPPALCDAFDLLLRAPGWRAAHRPDLIVELGAPPTSRVWSRYADEQRGCRRIVIAPHGWSDPAGTADLIVQAAEAETALALAARLGAGAGATTWTEGWIGANRRARGWLDGALRRAAPMDEHAAMQAAVAALPDGALLALGNSLPVRTASAACTASRRRVGVLHQRGTAGIDGLIAGAAGAASAARAPTVLLCGDVSFAHDLGGLAAARAAGREAPLAIVVIDNGGGRIFEQLPVASAPGAGEILERFFLTPPEIDVAAAAAAFGLASARATSTAELSGAIATALAAPGATVIHAVVAPHSARDLERAAAAQLDEVLS